MDSAIFCPNNVVYLFLQLIGKLRLSSRAHAKLALRGPEVQPLAPAAKGSTVEGDVTDLSLRP